MIDVGKVFVDKTGAGRVYVPRRVVEEMNLQNKDQVKLEVKEKTLTVIALKEM